MKYFSILLLLALSFGVFGCEPESRSDAPLAEEFSVNEVVEQPVVEIKPEPQPEPEPVLLEPTVEALTGSNEKPVEEIAVVTADETDSEPGEMAADEKAEEPEAAEEEKAVEKTETDEVEDAAEKPKETDTPAAKENDKDQTAKKDEKSRPSLVDTEFFNNCDFVFKNFVDKDGLVDYLTLRRKKHELLAAVKELGDIPTEIRLLWSKNDEKAFLLNAHNILMINLIIDNYPIKANKWMSIWFPTNSIKHIPGAREKKFFRVAGLSYTLEELEELILKMTKDPTTKTLDPRYCFAISNATMMGGKLRNEAYRPDKLDKQLDEQVRKYFLDPQNLTIDTREKKIHLSSIIDFGNVKETFLNSRYAKIKRFRKRDPEVKAFLNFIFLNIDEKRAKEMESTDFEIEFRNFDWQLNEQPLR